MDIVQEAKAVLRRAESSLRDLMEGGLREQKYVQVAEVAKLADGVARVATGRTELATPPTQTIARPKKRQLQAQPKQRRAGQGPSRDYPRFERDGDKLIKVGWSKKNKSTYEHRAPREAVLAVIRHLSSVPDGVTFAVEDHLPMPDLSGDAEIPAYQVYLTLAWLRSVGLIEKRGRDGYTIAGDGLSNGAIDGNWNQLPERGTEGSSRR